MTAWLVFAAYCGLVLFVGAVCGLNEIEDEDELTPRPS